MLLKILKYWDDISEILKDKTITGLSQTVL